MRIGIGTLRLNNVKSKKRKTMKKIAMFIGLALVMLATSCSTDTTEVNLNGAKVTLGVSLDQTRTYMGELANGEYPVLWSEGDNILVNNKVVAVPAEYAGKAKLEVAVDAADEYKLAYPAELVDGNELTISEVQKFVDGSFAVGSGVMVGYSADASSVVLKNLYGYLKFTVTGAANVDAVTVVANGGESISGVYAIDYKEATITPLAGKDIIRVTEVVAKDGVATVVVAVPAGDYSAGFSVKVKDNANGVMTKSLKGAGAAVEAGVVYAMPEVAYAATETEAEITTVADLQAFIAAVNTVVEVPEGETAPCTYTAWISADGEVKLGADLDLTGVTLDPINTFDGVFNGQGYSIKNWNTNRGLFVLNTGVVKNVVIDASCTLTGAYNTTGDKNLGFVVESNEEPGLVAGCVNNGKVVATDISCAGHRIGGVVGTSYGMVHDCINNGDIDITSATIGNNQNIGGVIGYVNPNAGSKDALGKDIVANCINNGDVTVVFPCLPKKVCVGGVLGGTQNAASTSAAYLGQIKNCINNGAVKYRFEELASGTYGNVGGIVGYAQVNLINCDNYGRVEYTTPTDPANAGTRAAAGGVVGCNIFGVKDCNNYGELFVEGVWAAGTNDAAAAGSQGGTSMGGVVGCTGVYNKYSADYPVEGCNNYGDVNLNIACKTAGGTAGYMAGLVGFTTNDVKNCHNYGEVNIAAFMANAYLAGVVGYTQYGNVDNVSNNAPVTLTGKGMTTSGKTFYLAGVVGRALNITNCVNNGATTHVVEPCDITVSTIYSGAVAGYADTKIENCTLNAPYSLTTADNQASLRCAGVVGQVKTGTAPFNAVVNCNTTDKASVTLVTKNTKANYIGGIIGSCNNGVDGCTNEAPISVTTLEPNNGTSIYYVAGICGNQKETLSNSHNKGDITVDHGNSTCPLYAGTLVGMNHTAACIVKDCTNSGNLTIVNSASTDLKVGEFGGNNPTGDDGSEVTFENNTNTGVVTVNGQALGTPAETLAVDGKCWQLPASFSEVVAGSAAVVMFVDLGVTMPGKLIVAVDAETAYGPDAAGIGQMQMMYDYSVAATDATSGKIVIAQTDHFGDVTNVEVPYSNLTADSVTVDFTNMLGNMGITVCQCSLFTKQLTIQ